MLSERRNTAAATLFFAKALSNNGILLRTVIDKSGANGAGIKEVNKIFSRTVKISTIRSKYLNNITDHPSQGLLRIHLPVKGPSVYQTKNTPNTWLQIICGGGLYPRWN